MAPSRGQIVIESIIGLWSSMLKPIMGKKAYKGAAPYLLTLFVFILIMNWSGLLPGVGTVGLRDTAEITAAQIAEFENAGFHIIKNVDGVLTAERFVPFIRPANSDFNMTLSLALISFLLFFFFVFKYAGVGALYHDWFGNKAVKGEIPSPLFHLFFLIFFLVGLIEVISACLRPLSLSFRLFGNIYGGENLLNQIHTLAWSPNGLAMMVSWLLPLPFYFLEFLIGFIQAFIFTLLTALYIGLITKHDGGKEEAVH